MLRNTLAVFATLLPISALIVACGDGSSGDGSSDRYKPQTVSGAEVKASYVAMARAAYVDSLESARELQPASSTLIVTPTESNLEAAQAACKAARVRYQQSEIMRWDTALTLANWEGQVNAWPLDENHIVAIIETSEPINRELLLARNGADDNEANVTTGVHAIEFMLCGVDTHGTGPGAGERPASDYADDGSCVGLTKTVDPEATFHHNGRARTILETIVWHGGEAEAAKQRLL